MGLFSSKKKTYVASSVWNMAGDIKDRADYMKTTVVGNILLETNQSMGESITSSYLNGPGLALRSYARWARGASNYAANVGYVGGGINVGNSYDSGVLMSQIPHDATKDYVVLLDSDLGYADFQWWAEEYMILNYPDLLFTEWLADVVDGTNDITITFEDETTTTFSPVGFDTKKQYVYAMYQVVSGGVVGPLLVAGPHVVVPDEASFPPVPAGYTLYSDEVVVTPIDLNVLTVVDVTYSDATPPEHTETPSVVSTTYDNDQTIYDKFVLVNTTSSVRHLYTQNRAYTAVPGSPVVTVVTEDIGGGVTKTTTTTVTTEELVPELYYHMDEQDVVNDNFSEYRYFRYEKDTGNATLDALFDTPQTADQLFLPYIPVRINNQNIKDFSPELYRQTRSAYRKAMCGADLNKLVRNLNKNDQIGDLDFVYAVYGTSLNSPEQTARQYMFMFFEQVATANASSAMDFATWEAAQLAAEASREAYEEWQSRPPSNNRVPPPTILPYPRLPVITIHTRSTTNWMEFWMNITLNGIKRTVENQSFPTRKVGEYWSELGTSKVFKKHMTRVVHGSIHRYVQDVVIEVVRFYHKVGANTVEVIEVYGLKHENKVYDNKSVWITAKEAFEDPEESGFIIPLHENTFRSMRLIDATQLAMACTYLVFNTYKVVKKKWYQSGFFKLLVVVVIVVVSIVFAPAGAGAAGVLGSSATVGATLGFTGTAAIVAGTIANAIAAMIITKALSAAFGETFGGILGTIVTVALTAYGGVMGGGGNIDAGAFVSELTKADNLIAISNGLVKSVNSYMAEKAQGIMAETQRMMEQYKDDMLEVQKQYEEMFGTGGRAVIDPMMLTDAFAGDVGERPQTYIQRTLMCGSDVANMSQDLVNRFAQVTLDLNLPT